jgi:hypothetical protein
MAQVTAYIVLEFVEEINNPIENIGNAIIDAFHSSPKPIIKQPSTLEEIQNWLRNSTAYADGGKVKKFEVSGSGEGYPGDVVAEAIKSPTGRFVDTSGINRINLNDTNNYYGYYNRDVPGVINLGPKKLASPNPNFTPAEVLAHEHQHLLDREKDSLNLIYPGNPLARIPTNRRDAAKADINKVYNENAVSNDFKTNGFYPELARIQSKLPVGQNVFDTPIGKELLKSMPELKSYFYQATSPLGGTEMHSAGLPGENIKPIDNGPSTLEAIQNWMRNKTAY